MDKVVIFGRGLSARLAHFYLTHDSTYEIAAFALDRELVDQDAFEGRPLVPFDEVVERFPPGTHRMFVALGYARMNKFRAQRYADAKALGYELISYVSSRATVWPGIVIGDNCFIMEDTTIQPFARIGNDVTIWSAGHIGDHATVGDHNFISSHVVVSSSVTVEPNCFLGVNATIGEGLTVARETVVGAGANITSSTHERQVYTAPRAVRLALTSDRLPAV